MIHARSIRMHNASLLIMKMAIGGINVIIVDGVEILIFLISSFKYKRNPGCQSR